MKAKRTLLAAALTGAMGLGMIGDAAASIYARSYYSFYNFNLVFTDNGDFTTPGGAALRNFNLSLTNSASLNGSSAPLQTVSCSGTLSSNNCGAAGSRLDAGLAILGSPNPGENSYTFIGPSSNEYSRADSIIRTAEVTGDLNTNTSLIAEAELQTGTTARSSAELQSVSGLTFTFTVTGANAFLIQFNADASSFVQIDDPTAIFASAQSNRNAELKLVKDETGEEVVWRPDGTVGDNSNRSTSVVGGSFVSETDPFDLQRDFGVTTLPCSNDGRPTPGGCPTDIGSTSGFYQLIFSGLSDGTWTLTLNATNSVQLTRTPAPMPEPATLALLGVGLAGFGFAARRRKHA